MGIGRTITKAAGVTNKAAVAVNTAALLIQALGAAVALLKARKATKAD